MTDLNPQNPTGGLDRPAGAPTGASPSEPVIHVIPDNFYGAALKKKVVTPKKEAPKPVAPPPKPPVPPGLPGAVPPKPKNKLPLILIIAGAVLLLGGGGAAAYFFVFAKKPAPPVVTNQNTNTAPKPVCGDNTCDPTAESSLTCPADCGAPKPVCGDRKCDTPSETPQNCSSDCGPPPPVCGDNKCETPEDFKNCPADCQPPEPVPGLDSDSDGVTDLEEQTIFGTNPYDPDSDHDSFVDLNEILNLFNPAKPRPSMLKDNPGIALYRSADRAFEIFYPDRWTKKDNADEGTVFTAPSGEFIQILIEANTAGQSLMDWYLQQAPGVRSSEVQMFKTSGGYDEILSPDRLTAFVASGHRVFVISYNLGSVLDIQFKATFSMMISSLKITGDPPVPEKVPAAPPALPPVEPPPADDTLVPPVEVPPVEVPPVEVPPADTNTPPPPAP